MGLREEVLVYNNSKGGGCTMKKLLDSLDKKTRDDLQSVLDDELITSVAIAKYYQKQGNSISSTTVARHRRGDCSCGN